MPERLDQLVADSLGDLVPVDVPALGRRARRRRRARRGALVGALASMAVALVAVVVVPRGDDESQHVVTSPDQPKGFELAGAPVGSWSEGADLPLSPRADMFTAPLPDGRVLVWGGVPYVEQRPGPPLVLRDGAIYSPDEDAWQLIPPMPLQEGADFIGPSGGMVFTVVQIADDRMAVVGNGVGNVMSAGVYDIRDRTWAMAPVQTDLDGYVEGVGWDGSTIALVRTTAGTIQSSVTRPGPFTRRWSIGDEQWGTGSPPPLSPRSEVAESHTDGRVAIWGGTTTSTSPGSSPGTLYLGDGAIYDVTQDTWTSIPSSQSLPGAPFPIVAWQGDEVVAGAETLGAETLGTTPDTTGRPRPAGSFRPDTATWRTLPPTPVVSDPRPGTSPAGLWVPDGYFPGRGGRPFVLATVDRTPGDHPWYLAGHHWEQAPWPGLVGSDDLIISYGNPGNDSRPGPSQVAVRQSDGRWRPGVTTPFEREWAAAVLTADDRLVVLASAGADPHNQTRVFDPNG